MIPAVVAVLIRIGLKPAIARRLAKPALVMLIVLGIALLVWAAIALTYRAGSDAGGSEVRAEVAEQRADRVAEARVDERTAAQATTAIADRTVRADVLSETLVRTTIEDIRDALDAVPPAVAGAPPPAVPVDRLRDDINTSIARANRAAGPAAAP